MTVIFSDGYESGDYSNFTGSLSDAAAPAIITTSPHGGTKASRHAIAVTDGSDKQSCEYKSTTFPGSGVLVAEAYVRFPSGGSPVWGTGGQNSRAVLRISDGGNGQMLGATIVGDKTLQLSVKKKDNTALLIGSPVTLSADAWHLVRLILDRQGANPIATMKVDGSTVGTVTDTTSGSTGLGNSVGFVLWGAVSSQGATAESATFTVDTDDVATYDAEPSAPASSFTISPATIPSGHSGNIVLTLTGSGTSWDGTTVFTPSGVANVTKIGQSVTDATHATLTLTTGAGTGTLTVTESVTGSNTQDVTVAAATLSLSPSSVNPSTTTAIVVTGGNTLWAADSPTFTKATGTNAGSGTINSQSTSSNTLGGINFTAPSTTGTIVITDPSTGATATLTVASGPITLAHDDAHIKPFGFYVGASWLQSNNPGAYLKVKASPITGMKLNVDVSHLVAAGVSSFNYPVIKWSIDGGEWVTHRLLSSDAQITIATGLISGAHEALIVHKGYGSEGSPWGSSGVNPVDAVRITGVELDSGAAALTPATKSRLFRVKGDSITQGNHAADGDFFADDGDNTWAAHMARACGAEIVVQGFGGQQIDSGTGGGLASTHDKYDGNGHSRLSGGVMAIVSDDEFINIGTNDANSNKSDADFVTQYNALLADVCTKNPTARVWAMVPFSGQYRAAMQTLTLPANARIFDIDPTGTLVTPLLVNTIPSRLAHDGLHLGAYGSAVVGAMCAAKWEELTATGGGSGGGGARRGSLGLGL